MNRRGFLKSIGKIAAGFTILPSATTYLRSWKLSDGGLIIPDNELLNTGLILDWNLEYLKNLMREFYIINNPLTELNSDK